MKKQQKLFFVQYQNFKKSYFSFKLIVCLSLIFSTSLSFAHKNDKIVPTSNYSVERTEKKEGYTATPDIYKLDVVKGLNSDTPIAAVPGRPGLISGTVMQCPSITNQVYSIGAVANATSYIWTVPAGWSITAGAGTTSITVITGSSGQNGNITVKAQDASGPSAVRTLAVTVRPAFNSGAINTTGQTILPGGTPTTYIGSATAASGGEGIVYSWRSSADNYTNNILGATYATYLPPAFLRATTSYRRYAHNYAFNASPTVSTGTWTVTVNQLAKTTNNVTSTFSVAAYPNPYNETFNLSLTTSGIENVNIAVYDMMGKLLETHQVKPEEVANLQIGNNFVSGIYNVIVS
jgi:hypothetical protein